MVGGATGVGVMGLSPLYKTQVMNRDIHRGRVFSKKLMSNLGKMSGGGGSIAW